jgi:hypothetical protein
MSLSFSPASKGTISRSFLTFVWYMGMRMRTRARWCFMECSNAFLVAVDPKYSELWIFLLQWKWTWLLHSNNLRMFLKWCWHITLLPTLMDSSADDTCHGVRCSGVHAGRFRNRVITFLRSLGLSTRYCYVTYYYSTQMTWLIPTINKPCASEVVGSTTIINAPASSNISSCHGDKKDNSYTWRYG